MRHFVLIILVFSLIAGLGVADAVDRAELLKIKREIQRIKADEERERERDERLIGDLEQKVDKLERSSEKLQTRTSQQYQQLHDQLSANPSPAQFAREFQDYLGTHQFTLAGAVGGNFIYDRQTATNTFALDFEPIVLYWVTDWLLFEGTIEANLPPGGAAEFSVPVATAQIFLNDYLE